MSESDQVRNDAYVVIPPKEYARLYNTQYAKLTTLKKSVDPKEKNAIYLEATRKKHYPNVYKDIKNNYIITSSDQIQKALNETLNGDQQERQRKRIQMAKQLEEVIAGKQRRK